VITVDCVDAKVTQVRHLTMMLMLMHVQVALSRANENTF
jgi:hypothetical protein